LNGIAVKRRNEETKKRRNEEQQQQQQQQQPSQSTTKTINRTKERRAAQESIASKPRPTPPNHPILKTLFLNAFDGHSDSGALSRFKRSFGQPVFR